MSARTPFWLLSAAFVCCEPQAAHAQVRLQTEVSQRTVEQGQSFQLQLTALVDSGQPAPSSPRLPTPPGAVVHGPSMSTQQQVVMRGGAIEQRHGFTATWSITPNRLGKLRVGPASVLIGSMQHQGEAVVVEVVPAGQAPSPRARGMSPDPFDFFRRRSGSLFPPGMFDDPFGDPLSQRDAADAFAPSYPDEFAVQRAPDPVAFLRSELSKQSLVVGEQLTLSIYAYGSRGDFREINSNEPQAADFVSFPIVENSYQERRYRVDIGEEIWHAVKVRELALFPIRTGNLTLGKMRMGFQGRGYPSGTIQQGLTRESKLLTVQVTEPPLAGRPPGYRIGDVGRYELAARVEPRSARQGDAVAVTVTLSGVGNLPLKLPVPERAGVEWLEPQVSGEVEPEGSLVQGTRHFQYVVRLKQAGNIDLGEFRLPYWDPAQRAYATTAARLGRVEVSPSSSAAAGAAQEEPGSARKLSGALEARKRLGEPAQERWYASDSPWFWASLGLGPFSIVLTGGALQLARLLRRRLARRLQDAGSLAAQSLTAANAALDRGDAREAAAQAERALFLAVEAATGLKARGFLRQELEQKLGEAGVDAETARELSELLSRCELARFTGAADAAASTDIIGRSQELLARLARLRRSRGRSVVS